MEFYEIDSNLGTTNIKSSSSDTTAYGEKPSSTLDDSSNESQVKRFKHHPLNCGHHFRVFTLRPGKIDDPIDIDIWESSLEQPGRFDAVSYVWGDPTDSREIYCNRGEVMDIPKTLHQALVHLRQHDNSKTLWADSICINQHDNREKGHQVTYMRSIFRAAQGVLAWLGNGLAGDIDDAFTFISRTISHYLKEVAPLNDHEDFKAALAKVELPDRSKLKHYLRCIDDVTNQEYFRRTWIVQEVALARSVDLYCGLSHIKLSALMTFCKLARLTSDSTSYHRLYGTINSIFDNLWCSFGMTDHTSWLNENAILSNLSKRTYTGDLNVCNIQDFATILRASRKLQTTRPLDRIYALFGHPSACDTETRLPLMNANYDLDISELEHQLAACLFTNKKSLSYLRAVYHPDPSILHEDSLHCSWVPQWRFDLPSPGLIRGFHDEVLSDHCHSEFLADIKEKSRLYTSGLILGKVSTLIFEPFIERGKDAAGSKAANADQFMRNWNHLIHVHGVAASAVITLFISHGYANLSHDNHLNLANLLKFLRASKLYSREEILDSTWIPHIERLAENGYMGSLTSFHDRLFKHFKHRKFFVVYAGSKGYVGLGPSAMQDGDLCCTVFGSEAFLVIRPTIVAHQYRLVGGCIIAGLMEGEVGEMWLTGQLQKEEIILI